ncbi:MAG: 4Fe-4S dicluster domain-containing protein [Gemmatimonadota bacterium]
MERQTPPEPADPASDQAAPLDRRTFLRKCFLSSPVLLGILAVDEAAGEGEATEGACYGMGIRVDQCIGCGRCAAACKAENDVPREPFFFRTWVERYVVRERDEVAVDSPNGGIDGFPVQEADAGDVLRTFFVPKLCNHCTNAPCVQVCPVGATFSTAEGVVLVDRDYCIGCRYCIQACPYGARFLHPVTRTAEKCTFCYHRVSRGLAPACVEACPTGARIFGDIHRRSSPLARLFRFHNIQVLKPNLNTEPKVFYAELDGVVS